MAAHPLIIVSHTVASTANIRIIESGVTTHDLTVAAGTYWPDPLIQPPSTATSTGLLHYELSRAIQVGLGGLIGVVIDTTITSGLVPRVYDGFGATLWYEDAVTVDFQFQGAAAQTNTEGRRLLARMGFNAFATSPVAVPSTQEWGNDLDLVHGIWTPARGESGDVDLSGTGFAASTPTHGNVVYTLGLGDPQEDRLITLRAIPGPLTKTRSRASGYDYSFQRLVWQYLARGEKIRYYADRTATVRYLDAALTATGTSATLNSTAGYSAGQEIWIHGEKVTIVTVTSGTILQIHRNPLTAIAHARYMPVCASHVGTYAVEAEGGDVSMTSFLPERRSPKDDRWDFDLRLTRTVA